MGHIFHELGNLFLQTVPTVLFVFLLFVILDRIFFRPLTAVMKQREDATSGALARARAQTEAAEAKTREYESAFQAARQDVYRQREAERRASLEERDAALGRARQQAEQVLRDGQAVLAREVATVKEELERASRPLAEEISHSLLGPATFTDNGGPQA